MKPIKATDAQKIAIMNDFKKFLDGLRMSDNRINYNQTVANLMNPNLKKPILDILPLAQLKMQKLVGTCTGEVGWHGLVERKDNVFTVYDVLVYPQFVTGATATTDDAEYAEWLCKQPDEIFNNIRLQGHSHVHMAVTPSGVDTNFYDKILQSLDENDFYIFCILNKNGLSNFWVYDFTQNAIFDKEDITFNGSLKEWFDAQAPLIRTQTYPVYPAAATAGFQSPAGGNLSATRNYGHPAKDNYRKSLADLRNEYDEEEAIYVNLRGEQIITKTQTLVENAFGKRGPGRPKKDKGGN